MHKAIRVLLVLKVLKASQVHKDLWVHKEVLVAAVHKVQLALQAHKVD